MYANPQFELVLRSVLDGEVAYDIEQMQSHHGNLDRVMPFRDLLDDRADSADHHVGVANRFDLKSVENHSSIRKIRRFFLID